MTTLFSKALILWGEISCWSLLRLKGLTLITLDQGAHKSKYLLNSKTASNSCCINLGLTGPEGVQLHFNANVFTTKVLIVDTIFTSPTGDGTAILRGHPSHAKVQPHEVQSDWVMVQPRESNPRPPALQSCALPTELIPPVQSQTQNNVKFQNTYTEILLHSTDECQPLDALKSSSTL